MKRKQLSLENIWGTNFKIKIEKDIMNKLKVRKIPGWIGSGVLYILWLERFS